MTSKKEQKLIDRLRGSGQAIHDAQLSARLKFIVRPFTTVGVETRPLASWFEDEIFSAINGLVFESRIEGIAIFPTIFDRNIANPPADYIKYKQAEKSVFVGVCIDFSLWATASGQERLRLLYENIKTSIERIPPTYLSNSDREKLISITNQAHVRLNDQLTH
jgi:hypothetical protein